MAATVYLKNLLNTKNDIILNLKWNAINFEKRQKEKNYSSENYFSNEILNINYTTLKTVTNTETLAIFLENIHTLNI